MTIEADVEPGRLARFFTKEDGHYRVVRELRDTVVFTIHDMTDRRPVLLHGSRLLSQSSHLFAPEAQHKVLSFFHFALRDGGVLFLGRVRGGGLATGTIQSRSPRSIASIAISAAAGQERSLFRSAPRPAAAACRRRRQTPLDRQRISTICRDALCSRPSLSLLC